MLITSHLMFYLKIKIYYFILFFNNLRDTYVERIRGESPNDYNDRMIRVAALWYNKHLDDKIKVLLLSSDEASKAKAINEGIPTMSREFVGIKNCNIVE